jgi:hypothetical protein
MYSVAYECYPELVSREKARAREMEEPMSLSATADGPWSHSLQKENQLPTYVIFQPGLFRAKIKWTIFSVDE